MPANKEEIQALIGRIGKEYQHVPLPFGLEIPGKDRRPLANAVLPEDMTDMTVLDIGSSLGFMSLECARRGATDILGLESNSSACDHAIDIATTLGVYGKRITYRNETFEQFVAENEVGEKPPGGMVDIVLCFNVLHHVYNPIQMLEDMSWIAGKRVILEFVTPLNGKYMKKYNGKALMGQPAMSVGRGTNVGDVMTFGFTPEAIEMICCIQRPLFKKVKFGKSPETDRRWAILYK